MVRSPPLFELAPTGTNPQRLQAQADSTPIHRSAVRTSCGAFAHPLAHPAHTGWLARGAGSSYHRQYCEADALMMSTHDVARHAQSHGAPTYDACLDTAAADVQPDTAGAACTQANSRRVCSAAGALSAAYYEARNCTGATYLFQVDACTPNVRHPDLPYSGGNGANRKGRVWHGATENVLERE